MFRAVKVHQCVVDWRRWQVFIFDMESSSSLLYRQVFHHSATSRIETAPKINRDTTKREDQKQKLVFAFPSTTQSQSSAINMPDGQSQNGMSPGRNQSKPNAKKPEHNMPCPWEGCDRLFTCQHNIDQHVREVHTGERPCMCELCALEGKLAGFARPASLNRHYRDVHKIDWDSTAGKERKGPVRKVIGMNTLPPKRVVPEKGVREASLPPSQASDQSPDTDWPQACHMGCGAQLETPEASLEHFHLAHPEIFEEMREVFQYQQEHRPHGEQLDENRADNFDNEENLSPDQQALLTAQDPSWFWNLSDAEIRNFLESESAQPEMANSVEPEAQNDDDMEWLENADIDMPDYEPSGEFDFGAFPQGLQDLFPELANTNAHTGNESGAVDNRNGESIPPSEAMDLVSEWNRKH